jgi:hypothetical protein
MSPGDVGLFKTCLVDKLKEGNQNKIRIPRPRTERRTGDPTGGRKVRMCSVLLLFLYNGGMRPST